MSRGRSWSAGMSDLRATAFGLLPFLLAASHLFTPVHGENHDTEISQSAAARTFAVSTLVAMPAPAFRVEVDAVLLNVAVGFNGEARELRASDFEILEDGVPQEICYFSRGDQSLSIVLLLDTSESMRRQALNEARRAAIELTEAAHPDTQFALVTFDSDIRKAVDFTTDRADIKSALSGLKADGHTRLFDGVRSALELLAQVRDRAKVIILLTDGKDEESKSAFADVEELLRRSEVTVFACGIYNPVYRRMFMNDKKYYMQPETEQHLNPVWVLKQLVSISGTEPYFPEPGDPLSAAFKQIALELRQRYVIGFTPFLGGQSRFRPVQVRVKEPVDAVILARPGYTR